MHKWLTFLLVILLLLPEGEGFIRRRRRRRRRKGSKRKGKAPEATKTPGVCLQATSAAQLKQQPGAKGKSVGQTQAGEQWLQYALVGSGWIVVKNSRGGGYAEKKQFKEIPCPDGASAAQGGAAAASGGAAAASEGAAAASEGAAAAQGGGDDEIQEKKSDVCVVPQKDVELRSLPSKSEGQSLGSTGAGEQWTQVGVLSNGWVRVQNDRGQGFTTPDGWTTCDNANQPQQQQEQQQPAPQALLRRQARRGGRRPRANLR